MFCWQVSTPWRFTCTTTDWCESPLNYIPKIPRLFRNLVYTSPITMSIAVTRKNSSTIITSAVTKAIRYIYIIYIAIEMGRVYPKFGFFEAPLWTITKYEKKIEGKMKKILVHIAMNSTRLSKTQFFGFNLHITICI